MTDEPIPQQQSAQKRNYGYGTALKRGIERRVTSPSWLARASGVGLSVVSIGFALLFLGVLESGGELTLVTRPLRMQMILALPYLVVVLTVSTTIGAILAWRKRYWSLRTRIHRTLLAVLGIGFVWQLGALGFISL